MNTGNTDWFPLCAASDLIRDGGVVARFAGQPIALFYLPDEEPALYAVGHQDPRSGANVIAHGLVGRLGGELVVAAPLYKQHFRLNDGTCLEDDGQRLPVWPARLENQQVLITHPVHSH